MFRRMTILTTVGFMSLASTLAAQVVFELVPDNPGPYVGGESLTVDVWLHSEVSFGVTLDYVQFDFTDTDPRLSLDEAFTFDFSTLGYPNDYLVYPELPVPFTANLLACWCPEWFLQMPAGGVLHIGSIGVELPTPPGAHRLEMLNADEPHDALGAQILTDSVCMGCPVGGLWRAYTGEITGGAFDFVIPPPIPTLSTWGMTAMGLLLLAAGCVFTRRRPKARSRFVAAICAVSVSLTLSPDVSAEPGEIPVKLVDIGIDSGLLRASISL